MQERYERIDQFLKFWRDICIENSDYYINKDDIYSRLIRLGVDYKKDYNVDLADTFDKWIEYYSNNPNIMVFNSPNWQYFCQFRSRDNKTTRAKNHIKIYIPLDSEHIEKGAEMLFDFISVNNISHVSKIGKKIRFDDIVIRVVDEYDARKILNFVNNNKYIQEGLLKPNPFAFSQDGIALACDGHISYNNVISHLINAYIVDKKGKDLNAIGFEDFYNFVIDIYNKEFTLNQDNIFRHMIMQTGYRNDYIENRNNYMEVCELILSSINTNFNLNDYFNFFNSCLVKSSQIVLSREEVNDLLLSAASTIAKAGYNAYNQIQAYVDNNDELMITSRNGLRKELISKNFRQNLIRELNGISVSKYIQKLIGYNLNNDDDFIQNNDDDFIQNNDDFNNINYNSLSIDFIDTTSKKYGYRTANIMLKEYLETGNERKITRDNNLRFNIVNSNYRNKVLDIIKKKQIGIDQYIYSIQRFFNSDILFESLKATYLKYQNEGKNGNAQLFYALSCIFNDNNYGAITSSNHAREDIQMLSKEIIMGILINNSNYHYKESYSNQEIDYLIMNYINYVEQRIIENYKKNNAL